MIINRFKIIPVLLLTGIFFSCENKIEKVNLVTGHKELPAESGRNVEVLYSDSGVVQMRLIAPRLERYIGEEPYVEFPEGIKVIFYNSLQEPESQITANYAVNYIKERKMEAKNNVIVINKEGEMVNTEHLVWEEETGKIYTDEFVKITTEDEIIYGDGMEANQDFTQYKIKNIKGTIQIKEDKEDEEI